MGWIFRLYQGLLDHFQGQIHPWYLRDCWRGVFKNVNPLEIGFVVAFTVDTLKIIVEAKKFCLFF